MKRTRWEQNRVLRNDAGVTLVEMMLAAGVLAVVLSIMFGALVSINVMGEVAEGRTRASMILAGVLEEVRNIEYEDLLAFVPTPTPPPGMEIGVALDIFDAAGTPITLPVGGGSANLGPMPNPLEVRATILWSKGPNGRVYTMSSSTFHGR